MATPASIFLMHLVYQLLVVENAVITDVPTVTVSKSAASVNIQYCCLQYTEALELLPKTLNTPVRHWTALIPLKGVKVGYAAKKHTAGLAYRKIANVTEYDTDKYGRIVGVVEVDGLNVNYTEGAAIQNGYSAFIAACIAAYTRCNPVFW